MKNLIIFPTANQIDELLMSTNNAALILMRKNKSDSLFLVFDNYHFPSSIYMVMPVSPFPYDCDSDIAPRVNVA